MSSPSSPRFQDLPHPSGQSVGRPKSANEFARGVFTRPWRNFPKSNLPLCILLFISLALFVRTVHRNHSTVQHHSFDGHDGPLRRSPMRVPSTVLRKTPPAHYPIHGSDNMNHRYLPEEVRRRQEHAQEHRAGREERQGRRKGRKANAMPESPASPSDEKNNAPASTDAKEGMDTTVVRDGQVEADLPKQVKRSQHDRKRSATNRLDKEDTPASEGQNDTAKSAEDVVTAPQ